MMTMSPGRTRGPDMTPAPSLRGETHHRPLSPRETECLAMYARTGNFGDAAAALGTASGTFKNHVANAYAKLGVNSAIEAFRVLGWLVVPERSDG